MGKHDVTHNGILCTRNETKMCEIELVTEVSGIGSKTICSNVMTMRKLNLVHKSVCKDLEGYLVNWLAVFWGGPNAPNRCLQRHDTDNQILSMEMIAGVYKI
ncbi:hypothetical protein BBBOND_0204570 [Babesia bigemina]|uniref:Uncharacterized protein n=1 Tax=Babesia bigemina TaxID=5866 RepID=A0A061D8V2_BABBI|nr:hypothetical protein BBBOND_0204570 [Babesia bigemina]CDR95299.1 hypothetical protein BBBOND_0204570 [Babesia bigemina]|eukprot:XP_012767485.1 hypothetical protein BBBOND_0204570 [Babesia bigemina]